MRLFIQLLIISTVLSSCNRYGAAAKLEREREALKKAPESTAQAFEVALDREAFKKLVMSPTGIAGIRLVRVFGREVDPSTTRPEYKVFDVRMGSAYETLGLRNNDVLVSVNGFTITSPQNFPIFVRKLAEEPGGTFEVRRAGETLLLKVSFSG